METSGLRSEPGVGENDPSTMSGASTDEIKKIITRMHSSRMRTGRSLTVCWSLLLGGCTWSWGATQSWGVYLVTPPRGQNHRQPVKNITLAATSLLAGNYSKSVSRNLFFYFGTCF